VTDGNHLEDPTKLVTGRVPPSDLDAEGAILSTVLLTHGDIDRCIAVGLQPVHFYADANRRIYESCLNLHEGHEEIDIVAVAGDLRHHSRLDQVGGTPYLAQLADAPFVGTRLEQHCRTVITAWRARQAISLVQVAQASLYVPHGVPYQALIEQHEQAFWELAQEGREAGYENAGDIAGRTLTTLAAALRDGKTLMGVTTGFADLDKQTTGWHAGELVILAARPGMGKTSCACSMILNMTTPPRQETDELPGAVYFHSCEMPKEDISLRLVCSLAQVEFQKLRLNLITTRDWEKLFAAVADLAKRFIFIDDKPAVTVNELRSNIRKIKRQIDLGLIKAKGLILAAVDYLQLMTGEKGQGREREIASITQGLKNTAKTEKVPMLALAQLNRAVETRGGGTKGKRPQLSDIRESGSGEQDADTVMFIYREGYYDKEANNEVEIIIAKQRNGPTCTVMLAFDGPTTTFKPLARGYEEFSDIGDDPMAGQDHYYQE
jgi:replicative DNA helicase